MAVIRLSTGGIGSLKARPAPLTDAALIGTFRLLESPGLLARHALGQVGVAELIEAPLLGGRLEAPLGDSKAALVIEAVVVRFQP